MAPLLDRLFENPGEIPREAVKPLVVPDLHGDLTAALAALGWDKQSAAGAVGLELSPDNARVLAARFIMVGQLSAENATFQASKLWSGADKEATVTFKFPTGQAFRFNAGNMASDYLDGDNVNMTAAKGEQPILPTHWKDHGIGDCTLRIVAALDRSSNSRTGPVFKFTTLFFPHSVEQLDELSDNSQGPGWPGIKILEGKAALVPRAPDGSWGCPIYPLIAAGKPVEDPAELPNGAELRYHIAKVLSSAKKPVACTSHRALAEKWKKIIEDEEQYEEATPSVTWPEPALPDSNTG